MKFSFSLLFTLAFCSSIAQFNFGYEYHTIIPVLHNGDTLLNPWAGGLNNPQVSTIKINDDAQVDAFLFDRDGNRRIPFVKNAEGRFVFEPQTIQKFPKSNWNFYLLRDYDNDGKKDIFMSGYNNRGIDVYRNLGTYPPTFEQVADQLRFSIPGASAVDFFTPANDLPVIGDVDGDGDLDVLIQGQVDITPYVLLLVKNMSQELYGHSDSLKFKLINHCWGKVSEFPNETGWSVFACDTGGAANRGRHGGSTLAGMDINNDGLFDLITGDSYAGNLFTLENTTDNTYAVVDLSLSVANFPSNDEAADVPTLPAAYLEDMDDDGIVDMMVSPNQVNSVASFSIDTSISTVVDWYYKNEGSNTTPAFELEKKGFFSTEMVDVGSRSFPTLVDFNDDGLLDMIVGNEGYQTYGGSASASLTAYKNVGTAGNPIYELHEKDVADISGFDFSTAHPALADIDGDGDPDLIVGDEEGNLHLFENQASGGNYNFSLETPVYEDIDVGLEAHPSFFDLNSDGLMDLVIGDYYGRIHYYENSGSATNPSFSQNATIEEMGGIQNFNSHKGAAVPYFTRGLDSLGTNLYLLQGTGTGQILVYGPITNLTENFSVVDSLIVEATYTSITGGNLFGDLRDELLVGQKTGGLFLLNKVNNIPIGMEEVGSSSSVLDVYPNPGSGIFTLALSNPSNGNGSLRIADLRGNLIREQSITGSNGSINLKIDLSSHPMGVYLVSIALNDVVSWARIIKQ